MIYQSKETLLYLDNISVSYDEKVLTDPTKSYVLKNVNLEEKDTVREGVITGQTIAFVGRSGRGKSSLFKVLTGLLKPTDGRALVKDFNGADGAAKIVGEGDVGFVNQKYTLFRHKTVEESLFFALRNSKMTKEEKKFRVENILENWQMTNQRGKYPNEMSGGQQQRTAIMEQVLSSGNFIVLDEPFSGLDVGNIKSVKKSFSNITTENDLNTIIFSTHDINLAVELADSIHIVGHPIGESSYSTIVKSYDLKQMGLAWREFGVEHLDLVNQITNELLLS